MEKELQFQKNDIIEYCDEQYIVIEVNYHNDGGTVAEWNGEQASNVAITNFKWSAYGEHCKLVRRPNKTLDMSDGRLK